jgi:hypothetical protein
MYRPGQLCVVNSFETESQRFIHDPYGSAEFLWPLSHPPSHFIRCCLGKGKAVPQLTYGDAGGRGGIAPTHSRPRH